jgi:4-hydroxy-2-oxoheptanedioate aldolase
MKCNPLHEKLQRGKPAFGCSLMFPCPQLVEMLAHAGFDWVLLDCEHGSLSLADVEVMAMAADASSITAIGRPQSNAPEEIARIMDRGVAGVQVPHINTADDARRAVASVKFGPKSLRGLAQGTRPDKWGFSGGGPVFAELANRSSLVIVQIEHAEALPNVDEILQVPGIDVFFIGPSDLSQSLGHPGNPKAEPVAKAIETTLAKIRAAGKTPGMPATTETVAEAIRRGNRYIYTHVPRLIGSAVAGFRKAAEAGCGGGKA